MLAQYRSYVFRAFLKSSSEISSSQMNVTVFCAVGLIENRFSLNVPLRSPASRYTWNAG